MKKYGRWLFYAGVDNLAKDQKKIYAFEAQREEERKRARASAVKRESHGTSARLDSATHKGRMSQVHLGAQFEGTATIAELGNEASKDDYNVHSNATTSPVGHLI